MKSPLRTEGQAHSRVCIWNVHSGVYLLSIYYEPMTLFSPGLLQIKNIQPLPLSPSGSNRKTRGKVGAQNSTQMAVLLHTRLLWLLLNKITITQKRGIQEGVRKSET